MIRGLELEAITYADVVDWNMAQPQAAYIPETGGCKDGWKQIAAYAKMLRIAAFLNEDWVYNPGWISVDFQKAGYRIAYSGLGFEPLPCDAIWMFGWPIFASYELCLKAIELMGDDLYTLFGLPTPDNAPQD